MKVLIATGIYPPDIGGPATYSKLLFEELPKRGIEVEVLSFGEVRHLPKIVRHLAYFLKVLKRARGSDIVFAQDPVSVGFPTAVAAKILHKKFVLKVVGDYAWEQYMPSVSGHRSPAVSVDDFQERKFDWLTELRKKIERRVARRADEIITPSEYLKKIIIKWGIKEDKIKVVYNAFNALKPETSKEGARGKLSGVCKLKADDFLIISAGRLVPWKGFKTLIGIMPKILKEIPTAKLFIIGSGNDREALETAIANHGLRNNVFLLGQLSREKLLLWLCAGDIFILNTGYEGFSHQLLEAMAVGIPVITTDIGGNPEMIKNKENGFLVEYDNKEELKKAIFKLRSDRELRNKIIRNAEQKVGKFNKEKMLEDLVSILEKVKMPILGK